MTLRGRWTSWSGLPFWLPAVVAVVQVVGTIGAAAHNGPGHAPLDARAVVLLLAGPAALVVRRRYPVPVLLFVLAVSLGYVQVGYPFGPFLLSPVIAVVNAVRQGHRMAAWIAAAAVYAGQLLLRALVGEQGPTAVQATIVAGWMLVVLIGGELLRIRHERLEESRRAAAAESAGRVTEERLRIARELHDVVAHNISLINVQAGVALHLMDAQPEQARTALTAIKASSKEALVELRSVLGVLRQVDEPGPRHPAPTLGRLEDLLGGTRQAGLDVRLVIEGRPRALPVGVDVAAYRIVQEALTNVLRHAKAHIVHVRVVYGDEALTVEVVDDGASAGVPASSGRTGGAGIAGMRERVVALGGELSAGTAPGGGFRVLAELPTARTQTEGVP